MNIPNIVSRFSMIAAAAICLLSLSPARAQSNRTWVSPSGNDSFPCTGTKPCRTFAGALAKTNAGGEIVVQESGGFGPVTINKSITIDGGGKYAGIDAASLGNGITLQTASSDSVVLRGLTINGLGIGARGINEYFSSVAALHVENCVISGFAIGIYVDSGTAALFVKDTTIRGNKASGAGDGIDTYSGKTSVGHCRLENNGGAGLWVYGGQTTVRDTVASGNSTGIGGVGNLYIESCEASNNSSTGIFAAGGSTVLSNSIVTGNPNYGLWQLGVGTLLYSRGNNTVAGNGTDVVGTITPLTGT
jgi:hypothetical protein